MGVRVNPKDLPEDLRRTAEEIVSRMPKPKRRKTRKPSYTPGVMNGTERRYAEQLEVDRLAGLVRGWRFETGALYLAHACTYTPDFYVVMADGSVFMDDIKGRKGRSFFAHDDARLKIKFAARLYPQYTFRFVWPGPGNKGWEYRIVPQR